MAESDRDLDQQQSDFEKVQDFIKEQVRESFAELSKTFKPETPDPVRVQTEQDLARQQLKEAIEPFYRDDVDSAKFDAANAQDYVKFYKQHPDAFEMEEQVEQTFEALKKAGRPTSRADILRYLIGKEAIEQPDKYNERVSARKKRELERANGALDFGANASQREKVDNQFKEFAKLDVEEMERALEGIAF